MLVSIHTKTFLTCKHGMQIRINKTRRLNHVGILLKLAMQKCIINVQLSNGPIFLNSNGEDNSNSYWFNNMTKRLIIINTMLLMKSFGHQPCFIARNTTIRISFNLKNPFASNIFDFGAWWNKSPSAMFNQSSELL